MVDLTQTLVDYSTKITELDLNLAEISQNLKEAQHSLFVLEAEINAKIAYDKTLNNESIRRATADVVKLESAKWVELETSVIPTLKKRQAEVKAHRDAYYRLYSIYLATAN